MKFQVENLVRLYRKYATAIPSPVGAKIQPSEINGEIGLQTFWQVRNIEQAEKSTFSINYNISHGLNKNTSVNQVGFPLELGSEGISTISRNGNQRATIRKFTDKKGQKKQILEIWSTKSKIKTFDLSTFDVHGDVCEDGLFRSLNFSSDGRKLLYIAERKKPKSESFFSQKAKPSEDKVEKGIGQFVEEWGEQVVGRHNPAPFIFDIEEESIESVTTISDEFSCGDAIWGPSDDQIVFIAWPVKPRRLGLIFCKIRPNKVLHYKISSKELSVLYEDSNWCSECPRISLDGKCMIFLNNQIGGAHAHCTRLLKYDFESNNVSVIVDIVHTPKKSEFPGIYTSKLPSKCWLPDNIHIIFPSIWRSKQEILSINTKTKSVERLTNDDKIGEWNILDLNENYVVACRSSPSIKPHLVFSSCEIKDGLLKLSEWHLVQPFSEQVISDIEWSIHSIQPEDSQDEWMEYEVVIVRPTDIPGKLPAIVIPHGGPHSSFSPTYYLDLALYSKLGFSVIATNYRGSLGFGETPLQSLLGKVGTQDVKDMQRAVEWAMTLSWIDSSKVAVCGGSHGGFLATHLIGQYPDFYKACVCSNPVTDLRGKLEATDIPDWGWAEVGLDYELCNYATPEVCKTLWEKSPCQFISNIKTPVLMLLGKDDLRVPPTQGLNYYFALRAQGKVDTRLFVYEDNHSISKVDNQSDSFIRKILFLSEKLGLIEEL